MIQDRVRMMIVVACVAASLPYPARAKGFSTVLPLRFDMPASRMVPPSNGPSAGSGHWEPAPMPRPMAAPPLRRTTIGRIVDFGRQFLPVGNGAPGHDPTTGTPISAFGPAYQDASLVGHGRAPPGETIGH